MSQWRSMGGQEDAERSADGRVQRRNNVLERCRGSGDVGRHGGTCGGLGSMPNSNEAAKAWLARFVWPCCIGPYIRCVIHWRSTRGQSPRTACLGYSMPTDAWLMTIDLVTKGWV